MVRKSLLTPKNTIIILSSLVILFAIFVTLTQIGKKQLIGSKAAPANCIVIPSMNSISSTASTLPVNSAFCVQVPNSLYKTAMVTAARLYIQQTGNTKIGEPIDTNLVSYNNIRGTLAYGPPYEKKPVEFYYYYYVNTTYGRVQIRVTSGTIGGSRQMSEAERGTIEVEANNMALHLWGVYSHLVVPTNIYNDANYIYVTFKVLSPATSCSSCGYSDSEVAACPKSVVCTRGYCKSYKAACGNNANCWPKGSCYDPVRPRY
jgi:hypothetical protein